MASQLLKTLGILALSTTFACTKIDIDKKIEMPQVYDFNTNAFARCPTKVDPIQPIKIEIDWDILIPVVEQEYRIETLSEETLPSGRKCLIGIANNETRYFFYQTSPGEYTNVYTIFPVRPINVNSSKELKK